MSIRVHVCASVSTRAFAARYRLKHMLPVLRGELIEYGRCYLYDCLWWWMPLIRALKFEIILQSSIFSYLHLLPLSFPASVLYHLLSLSLYHSSGFIMWSLITCWRWHDWNTSACFCPPMACKGAIRAEVRINSALWEDCPEAFWEDTIIVDTSALSTCGGVYDQLCRGLGGWWLSEWISTLQ